MEKTFKKRYNQKIILVFTYATNRYFPDQIQD